MSTTAYQGKYFAIRLDENGTEYVDARDSEVLIIPLKANGEVIFTEEPSPAFSEATLIVPGGSIALNETREITATRELREEVGYAPGRLEYVGELRPFSKYLTVRSYVYLARDLTPARLKGDENYSIGQVHIALSAFETLITSGRLLDARVIAALYMARGFLQRAQ